jgi:phosphate transport system protein
MEHRIIDQRLQFLRDKLLLLGGATENALHRSMQSLIERNSTLAEQVVKDDALINQMELEIDRLSIEILALQQPAAHDLRFVISVAKITPILERIADHATSIAKAAVELNDEPEINVYGGFSEMAERATEMLQSALDVFTSNDAEKARELIARDEEIDQIYEDLFNNLMETMSRDVTKSTRLARLLFVAKHLERIGDYVKDICELTVYMKEAVLIKHQQ